MNKRDYINQTYNLIVKSIKEELTQEEAEQLVRWRAASVHNEEMYQRLTAGCPSSVFQRYMETCYLEGWEQIKEKATRERRRRGLFIRRVSAAVAVVCIGMGAWIIAGRGSLPDALPEVAEQVILPGGSKATLILSSGEQIQVGDSEAVDSEVLARHGLYREEQATIVDGTTEAPVEIHTWVVPRGGEFFLTLSDGTLVWLNSESKIIYPSRFTGSERRVTIEGEVFFDVKKNEACPFVVDVYGTQIDVTGTKFNVSAYDGIIETTLITGGVKMSAGGHEAILTPGEQAVYSRANNRLFVHKVETSAYVAWKDGVFEFSDMALSEIVKKLGRWYDVDFTFDRPEVTHFGFTGAFKKFNSIIFILDVIKATKSVDYDINGKTITLK